jgi:hypothetical protein
MVLTIFAYTNLSALFSGDVNVIEILLQVRLYRDELLADSLYFPLILIMHDIQAKLYCQLVMTGQ